jgi:hypothetical protein
MAQAEAIQSVVKKRRQRGVDMESQMYDGTHKALSFEMAFRRYEPLEAR